MKLDWERPTEDIKKEVMAEAENYSLQKNLDKKDSRRLRLAAEETMEMLSHLKSRRPHELRFAMEDECVTLRLITRTKYDGTAGKELPDYDKAQGVTGKLGLLYETRFEDLENDSSSAEKIGVRKAYKEDLKEIALLDTSDAYVWSLQSYDMTAFDQIMEDEDAGWQEISHSILANIAEDIRLFIFPKKTELDVRLAVGAEQKKEDGEYGISPEFDDLAKIPVVKSRFQVKLVQLLYGNLPGKQKSNDNVYIRSMKFSTGQSKKGTISVLRYTPVSNPDTVPAIVFFHGGADLFPALPYQYRLAEKLAVEASCRVFLVMHDLAPKYNPPAQILEGLDVYRQLIEQREYYINPEKVAVMGDSSGGTMAAALCLLAKDGYVPMPKGQMLLYPSLDMRYDTPSMKKYTDVPVINTEAIDCYRKIVRTDWSEGNKYYLSPAEAESVKGLCKTYIETAEFDPLHDEGVEYARRLEKEGIPVILNETKGTVHSFDMAANSQIVEAAIAKRVAFLKELWGEE